MITFTELIKAQVYETAIMIVSGMAVMIIFEIFSFIKFKSGMKKMAAAIFELMLWAFAGVLTCAFLYRAAFGAISFHSALAFIFGVFLWKKTLYGILFPCLIKKERAEAESSEKAVI